MPRAAPYLFRSRMRELKTERGELATRFFFLRLEEIEPSSKIMPPPPPPTSFVRARARELKTERF